MKKLRVLLADDHVMVRKGLKQILDATDDIVVIDEASNGKEVLEKIANTDHSVFPRFSECQCEHS